jgi:hypothetical protein
MLATTSRKKNTLDIAIPHEIVDYVVSFVFRPASKKEHNQVRHYNLGGLNNPDDVPMKGIFLMEGLHNSK